MTVGAYKCSPNFKAYRQGEGGSILILQLDRQSVSRPDWLANIYLIFLLEFLCQTCSHTHLAYPSTPYALSMKFTEATQHIMMKSWLCVRGLFSHLASRSSSVSLDVFNWLSANFALRNAQKRPQKRPHERSIWRYWPIMEGFRGTTLVAREHG